MGLLRWWPRPHSPICLSVHPSSIVPSTHLSPCGQRGAVERGGQLRGRRLLPDPAWVVGTLGHPQACPSPASLCQALCRGPRDSPCLLGTHISTGGRTGHPPVHCQRDTRGHGNRRALRPLGGPGVGGRRKDFWRMLGASQPGGEGALGLLRTLASRGRRAPAAVRARGGGGWGGGPGFLTHAGWLAPTQSQPCGPGALSTRVPALGWSARAALRTGAPQSTGPARTSVSAGWRVGSPNRTVDCAVCPLLSLAVGEGWRGGCARRGGVQVLWGP